MSSWHHKYLATVTGTCRLLAILASAGAAEVLVADTVDTSSLFPGASEFVQEIHTSLPQAQGDTVLFTRVIREGETVGYLYAGSAMGKEKPMDFSLAMDPRGRVTAAIITSYRSTGGQGVLADRFLRQFRGKGPQSRLKLGWDINGISGATFSSLGLVQAVRRAVRLWEQAYGDR